MDPKELQRRIILELATQAGPRGFTFAGRVAKPGDQLEEILKRIPANELESGGIAMQGPELLKAIIPTAMWKAMAPDAKAMMTVMANKYPEKFAEVLKHQQMLVAKVTPGMELREGRYGTLERLSPLTRQLRVDPKVINTETPIHELTHFLQNQRTARVEPDQAETVGRLISELLAKHGQRQGSINTQVKALGGWSEGFAGRPVDLVTNPASITNAGMARFGKVASSPQIPDEIYGVGLTKTQVDSLRNIRQKLIMDEGLAYLAASSSLPNANPTIVKLAKLLKVFPE